MKAKKITPIKATHEYSESKQRFAITKITFHITSDILEAAAHNVIEFDGMDQLTPAAIEQEALRRLAVEGKNYFFTYFQEANPQGPCEEAKEAVKKYYPNFYNA